MDQIIILKEMDSEAICDYLIALRNLGIYKDSDITMLGRNHFLLKRISQELEQVNISHTYIGRQNELINSELFVKFHAFLKLLVNPFSNLDFLLIRDLLGLSRKEYNEIRLRATQESKSHFQAWKETISNNSLAFEWFRQAGGTNWTFLEGLHNLLPIFNPGNHDAPVIDQTLAFIFGWMKENQNGSVAEYLDWLAVYDYSDEIKDDDNKLKIMTIHQAKGLEFPLVIIIGLNEGILPSKQSIEGGDVEISRERNLMYVAMTRARDNLILAVRPERKEDERGKIYENPESRFVREIK